VKTFYRFHFSPGPYSQHAQMFVYADDLASATNKVNDRLDAEYKGKATLLGRVESFPLADANRHVKTGWGLPQCLIANDVIEVCEDIRQVDPNAWTPSEKRIIVEFNEAEISIRMRRGTPRPLNAPPRPRRERVLKK
jgi:hypothetical protein